MPKIKTLFLFLPLLMICCLYNTENETNVDKSKIIEQANTSVINASVSPSPSLRDPLPTSYITCGCGCCTVLKPEKPRIVCLYHSKGDDIGEIILKDRTQASDERFCAKVGCALPVEYKYCD